MMEGLPNDLLVHILSWLDGEYGSKEELLLESTLSSLPRVCRSWKKGLDKSDFWNLMVSQMDCNPSRLDNPYEHRLEHYCDNDTGRTTTTRRASRRTKDPKTFFFQRRTVCRNSFRKNADARLLKIIQRLQTNDCVAFVRKQQLPATLVNHRIADLEHRTLLHYACWYGRSKTVKHLLQQGASIHNLDDSHASPLLIAAWAGQASVVKQVLSKLVSESSDCNDINSLLDVRGVPPLTSSCGGKGPKTALVWAQRKGFHWVVRLLEGAARTRK